MNEKLVKRAHNLLKELPYDFRVLKHRTENLHLIDMCYNKKYDWVVGVDEDAYCWDPQKIIEIKKYMEKTGYDIAGPVDMRMCFPHKELVTINQFFCVIHTERTKKVPLNLKTSLSETEELKKHNEDKLDPHFNFFYWMKRNNINFLLLDQRYDENLEATIVSDHQGNEFLIHSWKAREYKNNKKERERIDEVYKYAIKRCSSLRNS